MPALQKFRIFRSFLEESAFLREYARKYRKLIIIGLLALVSVDALEIAPPIFLKNAVDAATRGGPLAELGRIALAYLGVALVQSVGRYAWRMYLLRSSILAGQDVRSDFAHRLFSLPMSFYDRTPIGDLMSLSTSDVDAIRQALGAGLLVFADALFYFISVPIVMYWLSPGLTLLAFVPAPIIPWLVLRNEREIHARYEALQEAFGELSSLAQEGLTGIRVVKGFAREDAQVSRFRAAGADYVRKALKLARVTTAFGPILDFTMSLGLVLLLYFGGKLVGASSATAISLGTFVAFQRYIQKMVWPMAAVGMAVGHYQRAVTSAGRITTVFKQPNDVADVTTPELPAGARATGWKTPGAVSLRKLSFRFPGTDKLVLEDVSIDIEAGERVAFVGTVGSGKSALLSLLPRLYPVERGMLFIDGVDVCLWPAHELREQVGYVSQDVFLFSETVRENVAYGVRGEDPSLLEESTKLAAVHEDVLGLVGSYQTRLGERGVNLSGGQKQRLSIARAIAKRPPILVLDDALSSVDVRTEEKILAGLRARPGRNTEIIAAHRISTVREADRIVVLERGRIAQLGTHASLIAERSGAYFRFYEEQRLRADLESYVEGLDHALEGEAT